MSISFYKIVNAKNVGECYPKEEDYDLMTLVIIRLGDKEYHSEEKNLLDFLTIIFQPHQKGFREKLSRYISFNEALEVREDSTHRLEHTIADVIWLSQDFNAEEINYTKIR